MGFLVRLYKKSFLKRYDPDEAIPYHSCADFPGLVCEDGSFRNSAGVEIRYFFFSYAGYREDRLILFCPGMGAGHIEYYAEIEALCRGGFRVLTLDYTGCGESGGERLPSCNAPARDAAELLEHLKPREEIIPVGHSLGGYTVLNLAHLLPEVTQAVVISGFVSISDELMGVVKLRIIADRIRRYEKKLDPRLGSMDNRAYLASTRDQLLWIHSTDDPVVNYRYNAGQVLQIGNPNVRVVTVEHKKHTPQYTGEAIQRMNAWMGEYYRLLREKKLGSLREKKAFFADKPIGQMTEQDPAVYDEILQFLAY